jgi:epoxyqueuosine reductase QueG
MNDDEIKKAIAAGRRQGKTLTAKSEVDSQIDALKKAITSVVPIGMPKPPPKPRDPLQPRNGKELPPKAAKVMRRKTGHYEALQIRKLNEQLQEKLKESDRMRQRYFLTTAMLLRKFAAEDVAVLFTEQEYQAAMLAYIEVSNQPDGMLGITLRFNLEGDQKQ